jgi:hypothetical protein
MPEQGNYSYLNPAEDFSLNCQACGFTEEEEQAIVKFFAYIRQAEELKRASERLFSE